MKMIFEGAFEFKGFLDCRSLCMLRIAEIGDYTVCMATETPENPGTSITNAAEDLATQVSRSFDLPMQKMLWIEHYGTDYMESFARSKGEQTFDLVVFEMAEDRFCNPSWRRLRPEDILEVLPFDSIRQMLGRG
jgi:hypothetical protein